MIESRKLMAPLDPFSRVHAGDGASDVEHRTAGLPLHGVHRIKVTRVLFTIRVSGDIPSGYRVLLLGRPNKGTGRVRKRYPIAFIGGIYARPPSDP